MTPRLDDNDELAPAGGVAAGAGAGAAAAGGGCCALSEVAPSKATSNSSTRRRSRPRYPIAPLHELEVKFHQLPLARCYRASPAHVLPLGVGISARRSVPGSSSCAGGR